jgi:hypothetical protein
VPGVSLERDSGEHQQQVMHTGWRRVGPTSQGVAVKVEASWVCWLNQEEDKNWRVLLPGVDVDVVVVGASDAEDTDPSPCQLIPQESVELS